MYYFNYQLAAVITKCSSIQQDARKNQIAVKDIKNLAWYSSAGLLRIPQNIYIGQPCKWQCI